METSYIELNDRQLQFCEHVAKGIEPKDSYLLSGYKVKKQGDAQRCAQRLMEKEPIKEEIARLNAGGESRRAPEKDVASHVETSEKLAEKRGEVDVIDKAMTALTLALEDAKLPAAKRVDAVKQLLKLEEMRRNRAQENDGDALLRQFIAECKAERADAPVCSTCGQPMPDSGTPPATP
jgi:hypothetical protein